MSKPNHFECIAGLDPGEKNFAFSIVCEGQILEIGLFNHPITNLTSKEQLKTTKRKKKDVTTPKVTVRLEPMQVQFKLFSDATNKLFTDYHQEQYVLKEAYAERFQVRAIMQGKLSESIGFMHGIMAMQCHMLGAQFNTITAAQWKNKVNKHFNLDAFYKEVHKAFKLSPHETDASLMALTRGGQLEPPTALQLMKLYEELINAKA